MTHPKRVAILGSTGSIGRQALDVIAWHPDRFEVVALAARNDVALFREQVERFRPPMAALSAATNGPRMIGDTRLLRGVDGLVAAATESNADLVLVGTSGTAGLVPTIAALRAGRPVALANKEVLIMAGHLVMRAARESGAAVIPVDSEHSGIWQCLQGERSDQLRRVTLTASGGAFRDLPLEELRLVTPQAALQHPTWSMGPKITIDSATLMNKGLEVIEACWLFDLPLNRVGILLHRESIVHALVEFVDGSVKAQLALPDMRLPIQHALSYPERLPSPCRSLDLVGLGTLTFGEIDPHRFRCAFLALEAGRRGGSFPAVLNAADEVAVQLFMNELIRFDQIADLVEGVLERHVPVRDPELEQLYEIDRWAREACRALAASADLA